MLRLRSAALLQVVLFSGAILTAWSHRAHERHGYCSDHGTLIHLEQPPQASHEPAPLGAFAKQDHHAHGAHDCAVLAFLTSGVSAPDQTVTNAPLGLDDDATLLPDAGSTAAVPLLAQAPKASPPRA